MGLGNMIIKKAESMGYSARQKIENIPLFQQRKIDLAELLTEQGKKELQLLNEILQELKSLNKKFEYVNKIERVR